MSLLRLMSHTVLRRRRLGIALFQHTLLECLAGRVLLLQVVIQLPKRLLLFPILLSLLFLYKFAPFDLFQNWIRRLRVILGGDIVETVLGREPKVPVKRPVQSGCLFRLSWGQTALYVGLKFRDKVSCPWLRIPNESTGCGVSIFDKLRPRDLVFRRI